MYPDGDEEEDVWTDEEDLWTDEEEEENRWTDEEEEKDVCTDEEEEEPVLMRRATELQKKLMKHPNLNLATALGD